MSILNSPLPRVSVAGKLVVHGTAGNLVHLLLFAALLRYIHAEGTAAVTYARPRFRRVRRR
jgi:hypothetical protein